MTTTVDRPTTANRAVRDYRTWLTFEANARALDTLIGDFSDWLRDRKNWDDDLDEGRRTDGERELVVLRHQDSDGHTFRARLVEQSPVGTWRTDFTIRSSTDQSGWLALDVTNEHGKRVAVPDLVRRVMTSIDLFDGPARLGAAPTVIREMDMDYFHDVLCDPGRQGLVFVAATDALGNVDTFKQDLQLWTAQTQGLAQAYLLDPLATAQFARDVIPAQTPPPWTIRTYYPEVDPTDPVDARRHKILGRGRLATSSIDDVRYLLGSLARARSNERKVPAGVTRVMRALAREEDRLRVSRLTEAPKRPANVASQDNAGVETRDPQQSGATVVVADSPGAVAELAEQLATVQGERDHLLLELTRVQKVLDVPDLTDGSLESLRTGAAQSAVIRDEAMALARDLTARREALDDLTDQLTTIRERYEDAELAAVEAQQAMQKAVDEARYLRGLLRANAQYDDAAALVPEDATTEYPEDFTALLERIAELETHGVVFTGDRGTTQGLSALDPIGRIAGVTWEVLLVIVDFVASKQAGATLSMYDYLSNPPSGARPFPISKFAPGESETTMTMYGDLRVFPVPTDVAASGVATMEAHFKLAKAGMKSPRLHFLDDVHGTGRVYVGYIGPHLRTPNTN